MNIRQQKYSERLGVISDRQFQHALETFSLGRLISVEPVSQGLFGQNVYVTSTRGEFVLRGKPHYDWQFRNERLFVDLLHERTEVPVPYPYLLDADTSIFGWEYVIMPRLAGRNLSDDPNEDVLSDSDRLRIAEAQGRVLAQAHRLTHPCCGKYDLEANGIKPYEPDWCTLFAAQTLERLERAASFSANTPANDLRWARELLAEAETAVDCFAPTFYMQDFKPSNMVVDLVDGCWQVTGLFDLMEASFGHPEADISRLWIVYIESGREDLAYAFLNAYLPATTDVDRFVQRFPLFILHDRAIIWEWVQRTGGTWWNKHWTFRDWSGRFLRVEGSRICPQAVGGV